MISSQPRYDHFDISPNITLNIITTLYIITQFSKKSNSKIKNFQIFFFERRCILEDQALIPSINGCGFAVTCTQAGRKPLRMALRADATFDQAQQ